MRGTSLQVSIVVRRLGTDMEVDEAIKKAIGFVAIVYKEEKISHVGVEEIEFDEVKNEWSITIGFFRVWRNEDLTLPEIIAGQSRRRWNDRILKILRLSDDTGEVLSMKIRPCPSA